MTEDLIALAADLRTWARDASPLAARDTMLRAADALEARPPAIEGRGVAGTREAVARAAAIAWYDGDVAWEIQEERWKATWFKVADAILSALAQQPGEEGWRPLSEVPTDGKPIKVRVVTTYKWTPYKPDGQRQMKTKGRWQTLRSEYGGWINADLPEEGQWMPYPGRSAPPPALAGAEQLPDLQPGDDEARG